MTKHYSNTQIGMYLRCPQQYAFRYVEGLKIPPASSLVQGIAYHKALEFNHIQKIGSKKDLPVEEVQDAYSTAFDSSVAQGVEWSGEELSHGIDNTKGKLKDEGIGLVKAYQTELAPSIQPIAVEKSFTLAFEDTDYTLEGRMDLIDEKNIIHDNKTSAKSPSKGPDGRYVSSPQELIQGSIYALAEETHLGDSKVLFDYAIKTKVPKALQVETTIRKTDRNFVINLVSGIDQAVKKEVFIPNRTSWMCSQDSCGFHKICVERNGGTVKP